MTDVTRLISQIQHGNRAAFAKFLPPVHDELRKLAAAKWRANERRYAATNRKLNKAYLRLVGSDGDDPWDGRGHLFAAATVARHSTWIPPQRCVILVSLVPPPRANWQGNAS
jgi:hypothetical protein